MTVLLVILTVALFLMLDYLLVRRKARQQQPDPGKPFLAPLKPASALEPLWVAGYQLPEELHYHRGHTWVRVLGQETALVGLDDFASRLVGPAKRLKLPAIGSWLSQGAKGFSVEVDGKTADLLTPADGRVVEVNPELGDRPHIATQDPYGRGWILKLRSANLARNLHNLLSGSLARRWMEDSKNQLDLHLMALSGSVLQDGGEPVADFARQLSGADWNRLVHEFLLT